MKNTIYISAVFILGMAVTQGCKPKPNNITGGGKGGIAVIAATCDYYGTLLDTCTVYIKYNTHDAPANGVYDDSAASVLVNNWPTATFDSLTAGNYYLLAVGIHAGSLSRGASPCTIAQTGTTKALIVTGHN